VQWAGGGASSHAPAAKKQLHTPLIRHTVQPPQYAATKVRVAKVRVAQLRSGCRCSNALQNGGHCSSACSIAAFKKSHLPYHNTDDRHAVVGGIAPKTITVRPAELRSTPRAGSQVPHVRTACDTVAREPSSQCKAASAAQSCVRGRLRCVLLRLMARC
jgi:hypothetical protein